MRHKKAGLKLSRTSSHRNAMFRNMVTSLFKYERIKTTDTKAKELKRWADNIITLAKRGDLHARRQALAIIRERKIVDKIFDGASERFNISSGGYTRVTKIGFRSGDAASLSIVELIASEVKAKPKNEKPSKKSKSESKSSGKEEKVEAKVSADEEASEPETEKDSAADTETKEK
ncbi:MAG: 50S ribosomal protein L17 [Proteobacteria bacterium]|nr:50S ribosomal protein L17 [Pseudomonadota bacterium]